MRRCEFFFFFKQKTAYEITYGDWSSDVCSSDLAIWGGSNPSLLWRTRRPVFQVARSLLMLGMPVCFILALGQGSPVETVLAVFWLSPLLIVALARAFLGES